ncbi:DUF5696 domain-containing protein [Paenibacillus sp. GCM10027626]|uniref:DUF5696 domain-containing protein n=1 Tax=Paenibacillus sp. GCM10027626 TaxID=3273411 RepID=UPI003635DBFA
MANAEMPHEPMRPPHKNGVRRLWPRSRRGWVWLLSTAACTAVLVIIVLVAATRTPLPTLAEMGIQVQKRASQPVYPDTPSWKPGPVDASGFAVAAENENYMLLLEPGTGQIAVKERQSGYVWRSNPPASRLENEMAKGQQLTNLQSPFVLEYVVTGKTQRSLTNALEPKPEIGYMKMERGIQATYAYPDLGFTLSLQYELTEAGLEVSVPSAGIKETSDNVILSLLVLPYFGTVSGAEEDGYLLVPDGPGGLIYYNRTRPALSNMTNNKYDFAIYDEDPANMQERLVPREPIAYPVFGLKRGDRAYAAIVKEGKFATRIQAVMGGLQSSYHSLGALFVYREEYNRKVGKLAPPVPTVQKARLQEDCRVEYRLLKGETADYSGMAAAYRDYLLATGQIGEKLPERQHVPLVLSLVGGATKESSGGDRYIPATTFEQGERIVEELATAGVADMRVLFRGWQDGGFRNSDRRFPVAPSLGGAEGAGQFAASLHKRGIPLLFEDYVTRMSVNNAAAAIKSNGIRGIDTVLFRDRKGENFLLKPETAVRSSKQTIDRLADLGADGIFYDGIGSTVFSDYNAAKPVSREQTAQLYGGLLDYTKQRLGLAATDRGNDYALRGSDLLTRVPLESSYDVLIDETVPFYPMAVHGSLVYAGVEGNLRDEYDKQLLKSIEYGAVPYYMLTYERSRKLLGTDYDFLFSGEFAVWKDRIIEEYKAFDRLAGVINQRIVRHEKAADNLFVTTYEDGTQVTVDYKANRFDVKKGGKTP